jgi:hypothetical protein
MHDLGVRIVSTLLLSGVLLFVAFLLFSILYPRKAVAGNGGSPAPVISSRPKDYATLLRWRVRLNGHFACAAVNFS